MSPADVAVLIQQAVKVTLTLAGPILGMGMAVGLTIALFQAVTQIQEMTLTFVPKIFAVLLTVLFLAGWMITVMVDYTHNLIVSIPGLIR
ncbi:flagellar biosynthesis protein FliQ [Desulfurivibrio alkaliphilus]|uniref:Flagellar biosynthetic protein FliQ n=1 Tax=Desulfurivibrio alkaliphilus (strain DSM 19089 / UNIQEM U267 / AHT2) TaxID=589865 RepID=D6Z4D6_DESAT|nr:flagellar biosynthesis protein FliQ [Desulfurivibrio alkaliphilus]ADH86411.1 flagellar biosynthetic protein FliQ [Desulfurivibrio alkaliphilus AHT 2]